MKNKISHCVHFYRKRREVHVATSTDFTGMRAVAKWAEDHNISWEYAKVYGPGTPLLCRFTIEEATQPMATLAP